MDSVVLIANAKINLTLDVLNKRPDGYHFIRSVMQSISLADRIQITRTGSVSEIKLKCSIPQVPTGPTNTAWQAAEAFFGKTGHRFGVEIRIDKKIPVAAGLAGGSADAAAVLLGLNQLSGRALSDTDLQAIGGKIGADVPFCLTGGTQLAEGIGEKLTPLPPLPNWSIVVIKPPISVSTAQVYQQFSPINYGDHFTNDFLQKHLRGYSVENFLGNILEEVTAKREPIIDQWKTRLRDEGAAAALMSGSGPSVFGLFSTEEQARDFLGKWQHHRTPMFLVKPARLGVHLVE